MEKYEKTVTELEALVRKIEDTSRPLGEINADVKKAVSLISECRKLLRDEETELNKLMSDEK